MQRPFSPRRVGFTLIELLVVIAIIAILIALLVPAVQKVRTAAARAQSTNNLKQLALGAQGYHDAYKFLPFNGTSNANVANNQSGSWAYQVLPYVEQTVIYDGQTGALPASWGQKIEVYTCPMRARPGYVTGSTGGPPLGPTPFTIPAGGTWSTTAPSSGSGAAAPPSTASVTWNAPTATSLSSLSSSIGGLSIMSSGGVMTLTFMNLLSFPVNGTYSSGAAPASGAGPVTDYGINPFLNTVAGTINTANTKRTLSTITDGSSNTILVGHAYLKVADYQTTAPVSGTIMPFFAGGTLATGRTGTTPGAFLQDGSSTTSNQWGGPIPEGGLMALADGTVRLFPYATPLANFLTPDDGVAVTPP